MTEGHNTVRYTVYVAHSFDAQLWSVPVDEAVWSLSRANLDQDGWRGDAVWNWAIVVSHGIITAQGVIALSIVLTSRWSTMKGGSVCPMSQSQMIVSAWPRSTRI